ncbi:MULTISPECIES: universal stress protein [unclassified Pseudomonas]|uniref:universal stress protein n=1 Tax=unclassified Pseudomonas TaxID=196821 RepID=UPI000A1D7E4C|nr:MULTISPECIES: universal stress protein [unclassified Pseudomonas]
MVKLKRILLIAPRETVRTPAFERARALACASGALLHIVAFDYVRVLAVAGLLDHEAMAQAREGYLQVHRHWLEQQARFQQCAGLQVTTEVVWSKASPAHLLDYVNDFHPDLVIKDARYVVALGRAFHRPADWQLMRECPAPLHLVTDAVHPAPQKILAAVDLSHLEELTQGLNDRILDVAATLAERCGASLHVLNVTRWAVTDGAPLSRPTACLDPRLSEAINDAQEEAFATLAERYGIAPACRHLLTGIPDEVIVRFARQGAFDMLVLGSAYRGIVGRLLGRTAESVLNRAPCSLVVVKPASWED